MKKKLFFSMAAISILTVGLLIWSCGDDGTPPDDEITIALAAAQETITADASDVGTITITATVTGADSVTFEITKKPDDSLASIPATASVADGVATAELDAGTKAGEVVVTGTAGEESAEVAVTVTAGALAGIKVRDTSPIGVITTSCPTIGFTFTAQLADAFGNTVEKAGESVTFSASTGTLEETAVTTDAKGQATAVMAEGVTAVVTATYDGSEADFDQVSFDDPLIVPPTAAEIVSETLPGFRANTAIIDPDPTDNQLGLAGALVNADLNGSVEDGTVNLLYTARPVLDDLSGENEIMFVGFTGLCGAPSGPIADCTGAETDYFIDPGSLDACNFPIIFAKGTITDGDLLVNLPELSLSFPVDGDTTIPLKLCDIEIKGTATMGPWAIAGDKIEDTYCPNGCASLAGFVSKTELCALVDTLMEGMCETVQSLLGDPAGECFGEDAYSMRLLFLANEVTLYEAP